MKRICIVVNSLMFGGVESVIENYYSGFDKSKFDISIIAQDNSDARCIDHFKGLGFKVILVAHKRNNPIKNIFQVRKIIKDGNFDILHCNMSFSNFYVLRYARIYGVKIRINHYHNVFREKGIKRLIIAKCNSLCYKYATHNVYCSNAVKEYLKYDEEKPSFVLQNAFQLKKFKFSEENRIKVREKLDVDDHTILIGQVGRLTRQKNQIFTLNLLARLVEDGIKFFAVFVGSGEDYDYLYKFVIDSNLTDRVRFLCATDQIAQYYSAFDVVLLPSLWEGLGIVALEAALSGAKVIISDNFPDEVILGNNINKYPLILSEWENIILENRNSYTDRDIDIKSYIEAGYDITMNRKRFMLFLENA